MIRNITVVGVGALGSHLVLNLRGDDVRLKIIDFDRVEQKNVQSQFHGRTQVGKLKTESLRQTMQFMFGSKVEAVPHRLTAGNVDVLLGGADLVVDALDNGESRRLVQTYVRAHGVPCVHGALAADGGFGRVTWDEAFVIDDEAVIGAVTCHAGEHLPFVVTVAAYLAVAVKTWLVSGKKMGWQVSPVGAIVV
jgi:predicted ThiF/HesA family dinucleotide-utilizing enzyme